MKFWIEFISSLCLKSFFPFRRHRRLWWARPGRQQWYPHSQYTPKNAGIINGNGWVSHPSAPSSNERHTLWLMDCPLLAKMCETDTPVHVLSFFLLPSHDSLRTQRRHADRFSNHAPARDAAYVLTGPGFFIWCGVHVQGPWLQAQSFSVFTSGDGTGNEY